MKYQNFKSDFTSVHTFHRQEGGTKTQIAVPEHVRLTFFTAERCGFIAVERNGAQMSGCSLSSDGLTLSANIPLSRKSLGTGELFCEIAEISADAAFPEQEKIEVTPVKLGVTLWPGKSDDSDEVQSELVMGIISKEVAAVIANCKTAAAAAGSAAESANGAGERKRRGRRRHGHIPCPRDRSCDGERVRHGRSRKDRLRFGGD